MSDGQAYSGGTFRRGAAVQMRVIGALIMRELHTRYGRENVGYLWVILEPMLLATMIALLHWQSPSHYMSDIKPVPLTILGYCNFIILRGIVNRAESAVESSLPLMYHRAVSIFDILLSRALLEAAGCVIALIVLMALATVLGMTNLPARPLYLLLGIACMFLLSFGLSMIVSAVTHDNRTAGRFVHPLTYIMMPLSGAFFCVDWLPFDFRRIIEWVPFVHIFELLRYGQFDGAKSIYIDPLYLTAWILGTLLVGLLGIAVVRGKIEIQ